MRRPTALVAEDEPLLREALVQLLGRAWPELEIIAEARNGREAIELFEAHRPDICFLDVHMPGVSGIDAARVIGHRAHLVFVTAYDKYAVQAFAQGVLDYLVKPVEPERLAATVARLKERTMRPTVNIQAILQQLAVQLAAPHSADTPLRWIRAQVGRTLRMISVDDVDYFKSDAKYTLVAWRDGDVLADALVRTGLKQLIEQLDPNHFAQVHRSVVVNLHSVSHIVRGDNETAEIHLKGRKDVLPVSRAFLHLFKQM